MRKAILATTVVFTLVTGQLSADQRKPAPADVGPGRIAWFDITTSNLAQSREFYGKLFDWTFTAVEGTDQAVEIVSRGAAVGTLRVAEGKIAPFNGAVYVQVADIQASCRKATELGGTLAPGFPLQSDRPSWRHRACARSVRPPGGYVLEDAAGAGRWSQVTVGWAIAAAVAVLRRRGSRHSPRGSAPASGQAGSAASTTGSGAP